ncbi:tetratricopeptide repeat protein [Lutibacter sp. HS1-25]|uniref:tetratricopeptide repeat protein n=1 Tax=Lutibacter sp. HS1-25 TaxID=2485000 RepID=UPI00101084DF|nr:tetratricopeptide repeat protein [Lutibacter sp. HS1-25]RXP45566.1 tetratricopeptide repeat protein [Lutibacter sp. HS1-25]
MKLKLIYIPIVLLFIISCNSKSNNDAFIKTTVGKYLYNSDEVVEVYFNKSVLYLKWRGALNIEPLKINDSTFFVKEMNKKIRFINSENNKTYMIFVPKDEKDTLEYKFRKLDSTEKIPSEYLKSNQFEKALEAYLTIQKKDSLDTAIDKKNFNKLGYIELRNKNYEKALQIFKINMILYPNSANVYDSYADALKQNGDTLQAVEFYKKSLKIDSGNQRAKRFIEKYD